ncbi:MULTISPECIES: PTS sugar transporter subunit IIB [unclassified Rathayibacter]|uniref:PTS sugar transporter subunit IIB n=1 Tax=unclassified Rathayibacter TaxID=2609250 RepID=UPI0015E3A6C0|nr:MULTISPECIES: PTS sugar transporter [unclassified Rathayibacter]
MDESRPGREEANEVRKILIVCGAGASSTFLAHRLRAGAKERGMDAVFRSETLTGLDHSLPEADVLLVGPHLESQFDGLRHRAELVGAAAALLPPDVFGAHGADAVLETLPVLFAARAVVAGADGDSSTRPVRPGQPDSGHH